MKGRIYDPETKGKSMRSCLSRRERRGEAKQGSEKQVFLERKTSSSSSDHKCSPGAGWDYFKRYLGILKTKIVCIRPHGLISRTPNG